MNNFYSDDTDLITDCRLTMIDIGSPLTVLESESMTVAKSVLEELQ